MSNAGQLYVSGHYSELWQRHCSFIDLKLSEFMEIQNRLLLEQLELLGKCEIGKIIMKGHRPRTVEEFRKVVPLTTYSDYQPYFSTKRDDVLPEKPYTWLHTSGRSGEYTKWVPVSERRYNEMGMMCFAALVFCSCRDHGEINIAVKDKWLYALAPPPYISGTWARFIEQYYPLTFLPPLDEAEKMSFNDTVQKATKLAMEKGIDLFGGMPSVLIAVANKFSEGTGNSNIIKLLNNPPILFRMARGILRSKMAGRKLLPRDLWTLKGILAGGAGTSIYRERIKEMWGRYPLDMYTFTEGGMIAVQTWDYRGMTFFPSLNYFEFISEKDSKILQRDPTYSPPTLLLDEIETNKNYELVITNFLGGAMIRYRVGDMIRVIAPRNDKLNIDIPQIVFYSRADNILDIAGFTRLTEKTIWQAIENMGMTYKDWTSRIENQEQPVLSIYLELDTKDQSAEEIARKIHQQLKILDSDYDSVESLLGMKPVKVTLLTPGSFQNYAETRQAAGSGQGQLKPPHINPTDRMLELLTIKTR
jgi:hypothetical protein